MLVVPLHVDRYEVVRLLGEGAAGKVYLARDPKLGRDVAVKVLRTGVDPSFRRRFVAEAQAIARLKHPNIVALHDYSGEQSSELYLVMEYVPGLSLFALTQEHGPMSEPTALGIGHEMALALEHAHARGIIHRDIKPENILLCEGRVVLTDFGIVKLVDTSTAGERGATRSRTETLGTPGFMPPEQFAGSSIGPHTDIFSLGAVLYDLTTGRVPYEGGSIEATYHNLRSGRYIDPREHRELLSADFAKLLARCLAPSVKDRLADAGELRTSILKLLKAHGVDEVRKELVAYERAPARHAVGQRDRRVDAMVAELKEALRERDASRANAVMQEIHKLAPLDPRMQQAAGIAADATVMRRQAGRRAGSFWLGLLVGLVVGGAGGVVVARLLAA